MGKLLAIFIKETRLRFASVWEWLFFLILPVLFTVILSGSTGGSADSRIRLVVVDQANSPLSQRVLAELQKSGSVNPELMSLEAAENELKEQQVAAILIIPAEYRLETLQKQAVELELRQQPNNMNAEALFRTAASVIERVGSELRVAATSVSEAERIRPFASQAERAAYFNTALEAAQQALQSAPARYEVQQAATVSEDQIDYDPRANSSAGQLITWVFIPLFGISGVFAYERTVGTLRRVLTTPTRKATYLFGIVSSHVVLAIVQMVMLMTFGILVMKLNWGQDIPALIVVMVASALAAAALGTTLGTFVKTDGQASGISIMMGMVMALLGGCWYPLELFPAFVQNAVKVLPTTWAMQAMLDLVLRGKGLVDILPETGVLLGFAVLFMAIGVARFKYE